MAKWRGLVDLLYNIYLLKPISSWRHRMMQKSQEQSYRARALQSSPWVCAHCGREFDGKKLNHLTVHHKDHNHHNNPPDGSNWELLCLYCHDNEHQRDQVGSGPNESLASREPRSTLHPFFVLLICSSATPQPDRSRS